MKCTARAKMQWTKYHTNSLFDTIAIANKKDNNLVLEHKIITLWV